MFFRGVLWKRRERGQVMNRIQEIHSRLGASIATTEPMLRFDRPFELLIAVILSAQTTDELVNRVTIELFDAYPTPRALAGARIGDVERIVYSTGFYRTKAKTIIAAAAVVVERYGGRIPRTIAELLEIPGVGRKSANVIVGTLFGEPAIIVDTHFARVTRRLGLATTGSPARIEAELRRLVPESIRYSFSMLINRHGRLICRARVPRCEECVIADLCVGAGIVS